MSIYFLVRLSNYAIPSHFGLMAFPNSKKEAIYCFYNWRIGDTLQRLEKVWCNQNEGGNFCADHSYLKHKTTFPIIEFAKDKTAISTRFYQETNFDLFLVFLQRDFWRWFKFAHFFFLGKIRNVSYP